MVAGDTWAAEVAVDMFAVEGMLTVVEGRVEMAVMAGRRMLEEMMAG